MKPIYILALICVGAFCGMTTALPAKTEISSTGGIPVVSIANSETTEIAKEPDSGAVYEAPIFIVRFGYVCVDNLNLRAEPNLGGAIIRGLIRGDRVEIREVVGRWGRIAQGGYVYLGYICDDEGERFVALSPAFDDVLK